MKQLAKSTLAAMGMELGRNPGWNSQNLQKDGFYPKTVFDVGAAYGTPPLYKAFSDCCHVLIEPLAEYKPHLENVLTQYSGFYVPCGAGAREETLAINVDPEQIMKSSLHQRTQLTTTNCQLEPREIRIRTLDSLREEYALEGPFGIKINAGGFEHQVALGATQVLQDAHFVIAEMSVADRFHNCAGFADFVRLMDERDFRLCDILDAPRRNKEIVLVNAVFRRKG